MLLAITRWVLAHRRVVVVFWAAVTLVGIAMSGKATEAMDQRFSVPGREGWTTSEEIRERFASGGDAAPLLPVVSLPEGTTVSSPGVREDLAKVDAVVERSVPGARVASFAGTSDRALVSEDGRTTFSLVYPPPSDEPFAAQTKSVEALEAGLRGVTVAGQPVRVTGFDALYTAESGGEEGNVLAETLIGGVGALAVLVFVFASLMAFLPLLMAVVAIPTTFLAVYGLTTFTEVSPIVQFLVALVGLGLAIDYALLIVVRWREERAHGHTGDEAIERAMATAGRAVVFSGTTVAVGLLALIALPLPFLRSLGYAGLLIPVISTLVAITLLPVLLHKWGPRLDWPHKRSDDKASRAWTRWAELVVRRRWLAVIASLAMLGALTFGASDLNLGTSNPDVLTGGGTAQEAFSDLKDAGIGSGVMAPYEILAPEADAAGVVRATEGLEGVQGAVAPDDPAWRRDGLAVVDVLPTPNPATGEARDLVADVRDAAHDVSPEVRVGGGMALNDDFISAVYGNFPLMIALISLLTFILLARAFRSLLLPLKAVLVNVLSVSAAWGVMTIVWQNGHGSQLWDIEPTGSINSWIPLIVFAFLYGLSMDYEVFILSRMREEYDRTGRTDASVVVGLGRTGRLVTSAALILFLAFMAMTAAPGAEIKVLATGLAAGIIIDATIIRGLLVPAAVSLFGRWNWWLPTGAARLLRVEPSLPAVEPARS